MVQPFARGLKLEVTDRTEFESYVDEHAHDRGVQKENWGSNGVPEAIYIDEYTEDDPSFYRTYDKHVNGTSSWNYWNDQLLRDMIDAGVLENTNEYDVSFVESQE